MLVVEFTLGVFRQGNIVFFDLSSRLLRSSFPSTWASIYIGTRGELESENDIHSPNLFDTPHSNVHCDCGSLEVAGRRGDFVWRYSLWEPTLWFVRGDGGGTGARSQ